MSIAPTQDAVQIALRAFLIAVLDGVMLSDDIIVAVENRVPEPIGNSFVVMSPMRITRLRTNIDSGEDVKFTGSIAGTAMTVSAVAFGTIRVDAKVFGVAVADGTKIIAQPSGTPGGVGVYTIAPAQTLSSRTLSTGEQALEQGTEAVVQLDFHTKDNSASDIAQIVSTTLRDPYGVELFRAQDPSGSISPLYADDPVYRPFINENQQYEWRWAVDVHLQVNQVVRVPQQYADEVDVTVISVEATYPPT